MTRNTISVQIKNKTVQALLDSGASSSVVSAEFVKRLQIPYQRLKADDSLNVFVADGRSVAVIGKTEFCVKINGLSMPCEALVLPQIGYSLILGLDFLEANKAQVDFANRIVTFFNNLAAANLSTSHQCRMSNSVCTLQPTILLPFSETIVPILLPPRHSSELAVCEPLPITRSQKFVCARSAIDSSKTNAVCKVLNPTNQVIWLPRHKALATLEPIYPHTLATITESGPQNTAPTTTPTASRDSNLGNSYDTASRPSSLDDLGMCYRSDYLSEEENTRLQALLHANIDIFF